MVEKITKKGIKSKTISQRENVNPDVRKNHYTSEELAKYCISKMNFDKSDVVLDVGAGENKIWFNNIPTSKKDWCEIELGIDFFDYNKEVDWCIGNPPFRELWDIIKKSCDLSNKGFAYLMAIDGINRLTPKRLSYIKEKGFYIQKINVVCCKRWFGRYFFVIFSKQPNKFMEWSNVNYE